MKLHYVNDFDSYDITASSEDLAYEIENVQHIHLCTKWRTSGDTDEYAKIDVGSGNTITPGCAFIAGHNITATGVVKIQGNSSDSWTSPAVSITMTRGDDIYYIHTGFSAQRYWRFSIGDTNNTDNYIEMGRLWLGESVSIDNGAARGFTEKRIDTTTQSFSKSGQIYADEGYRYKVYNMYFPYWTNTMKTAIETFANTVLLAQPFFVTFDVNNVDKLNPVYSVLTSGIDYTNLLSLTKWDGKLNFMEVF